MESVMRCAIRCGRHRWPSNLMRPHVRTQALARVEVAAGAIKTVPSEAVVLRLLNAAEQAAGLTEIVLSNGSSVRMGARTLCRVLAALCGRSLRSLVFRCRGLWVD
jgi:hypothetical protein